MKKKVISLLLILVLFLSFASSAFAFTEVSRDDPGGAIKGEPYYNSSADQVMIGYNSGLVKRVQLSIFYDAALTKAGTSKSQVAPDGTFYAATGFSCIGWYKVQAYSSTDVLLATYIIRIQDGDLVKPACNSNPEDETPTPPAEEEPSCADLICDCIRELQPSLDAINNSIKESNVKLDSIKSVLVEFKGEFQTDKTYNVKPLPDISNVLDQNRPVENTRPFADSTIYFKDGGDTIYNDPGKIPKAPEPKHWDGLLPELEKPPEAELTTEKEGIAETELQRDSEKALDSQLNVETELKKDSFQPSKELKLDVMQPTEQLQVDSFSQDGQLDQNHFYQQTNKFP